MMLIEFAQGEFIAKCTFEERLLPQRAGFKWDSARKRWVTRNSGLAMSFGASVLSEAARAAMGLTGALPVPEGREYLPFQEDGVRWGLEHEASLIADQPGLGKGHPVSTLIMTPAGYRAIGDLKVGDQVIGVTGVPAPVTGIFERGILPVYRVSFCDGASILVDGDHLWSVDVSAEEFETVDTIELAARVSRGESLAVPTLFAPAATVPGVYAVPPAFAALDAATTFGQSLRKVIPVYTKTIVPAAEHRAYGEGSAGQAQDYLSGFVRTIGRIRDGYIVLDLRRAPEAADLVATIRACVEKLGGLVFDEKRQRRTRLKLYLPDDIAWPVFGYVRRREKVRRRWKTFEGVVPPRKITAVTPAGRDQVRCISVDGYGSLYVAEHAIVTHNTVQGIGLFNAIPRLRSGLIIPPASLRKNWLKEWSRWSTRNDLSIDIAYGGNFPKSDIVIINYDLLNRHRENVRQREWDLGVADESHYLKNPDSGRTKEFHGGVKTEKVDGKKRKTRIIPIPLRRLLLLSGTPIANRPSDMWTTVQRCDPFRLGRDFYDFHREFCGGYDDFGQFVKDGEPTPEKLRELNHLMKQRFMLRRLKADVLKDLPPKIRQIVPLPMDGLRKKMEEEKAALTDLLDAYEKMVGIRREMSDADLIDAVLKISPATWEKYAETQNPEAGTIDMPLTRLARARQDLAVAKLPMIIEYVQNLLDTGEKVVVFGYHRAVIQGLLEAFDGKGFGVACIYGDTPMESTRFPERTRQAQADKFQEDPNCRLFIGQFTAAGVGFTLTKACHNVFAELTWVPHELLQAEDRIHRIGSEIWDAVWAHHLVVEGSLDDTFVVKLIEKMAIIELALD